ncbi:hypothetical protein Ahia01_001422200, partial [Argonauta hians]
MKDDMQISHSTIPVPVPLPVWYYGQCIRFPSGTSIHPAFSRALLPVPNAQGASLRLSPSSLSETSPTSHAALSSSSSPDSAAVSQWQQDIAKHRKNSFSIDAILNRDPCRPEDGMTSRKQQQQQQQDVLVEASTCLGKRGQRLYHTTPPYITTAYSANVQFQNHHQFQVCPEQKLGEY